MLSNINILMIVKPIEQRVCSGAIYISTNPSIFKTLDLYRRVIAKIILKFTHY
jgi:hypothetical protein